MQTIMKISSVKEALQRANANEYGLAAGRPTTPFLSRACVGAPGLHMGPHAHDSS